MIAGVPKDSPRSPAWTRALQVGVVAFAAVAVTQALLLKTQDFTVFWTAATRFVAGDPLYQAADGLNPYKYAPFVAPIFAPLSILPRTAGAAVWNLLSLAALVWTLRRGLRAVLDPADVERIDARVLCLACVPFLHALFFEFQRGQADLAVLALVIASAGWSAKRPALAGLALALAVGMKTPTAILGLYFLFERRWKAIAWAAGAVVLLEALVVVRYGFDAARAMHVAWPEILRDTTPSRVESSQGFLGVLFIGVSHARVAELLPLAQVATTLVFVTGLVALRPSRPVLLLSLLAGSASLSPLCWNPTHLVAVPAVALLVSRIGLESSGIQRSFAVGLGVFAVLFFVLTPGLVDPHTYNYWLEKLRPYPAFSLLVIGLLAWTERSRRASARTPAI